MRVVVFWVDNFVGHKFMCAFGEPGMLSVNVFGAESYRHFRELPSNWEAA